MNNLLMDYEKTNDISKYCGEATINELYLHIRLHDYKTNPPVTYCDSDCVYISETRTCYCTTTERYAATLNAAWECNNNGGQLAVMYTDPPNNMNPFLKKLFEGISIFPPQPPEGSQNCTVNCAAHVAYESYASGTKYDNTRSNNYLLDRGAGELSYMDVIFTSGSEFTAHLFNGTGSLDRSLYGICEYAPLPRDTRTASTSSSTKGILESSSSTPVTESSLIIIDQIPKQTSGKSGNTYVLFIQFLFHVTLFHTVVKPCAKVYVSEIDADYYFDETPADTVSTQKCPYAWEGQATWYCRTNGKWDGDYPNLRCAAIN
jgi:hypothetical protein